MRTMYDGVNSLAAGIARDFPGAQMIAGYLTGSYAWTAAEWALFPHAAHVTISTVGTANAGDVLDVEAGDATPAQAHDWIVMRKRAGLYRPTLYASKSRLAEIRVATRELILGRDYDIWEADWDGSSKPDYPLAVAKQFKNATGYDQSAVFDDGWPHRHAPVSPPPPVKPSILSLVATAHYSDGTAKTVQL